MKPWHLTLLAACMTLNACSGTPSDSRMASQIAGQFNQEFGTDFVRIEHLHVTKDHQDGKKRYIADAEYELSFTKSLAQVRDAAGPVQAMELLVLFGDFHAGDTKHMANRVVFEKDKDGWVLIHSRQEE